jgi:hypothetical protein
MAETDTKLDPSTQIAAGEEPKLVKDETEKVTTEVTEGSKENEKPPVAEKASEATSAVKDNVFSMFGGGPQKAKKEEPEEPVDEPSGSSKKKQDVSVQYLAVSLEWFKGSLTAYSSCRRRRSQTKPSPTSTSSQSSTLRKRLILRQTRSPKSRFSRCARSSSDSTVIAGSGRSVVLATFDSSSTKRMARPVSSCAVTGRSRSAPITMVWEIRKTLHREHH